MFLQIAEVMITIIIIPVIILVFQLSLVQGQSTDAITTQEYATRETPIAVMQLDITTGTQNDRIDDHEIHKRAEACPASPPGNKDSCILCPWDQLNNPLARDFKYEHTDENGVTCICDYCRQSKYMNGSCVCTPSGGLVLCIPADKGYTNMPFPNKCSVPFNCTMDIDCPGNLVVEQQCELNEDSVCGCQDGYYQSGETSCTQIPKCQENHQPELDNHPDEKYTSYQCVPCPDGQTQPHNNSLEKCSKAQDDTVTTKTTSGTASISTSTTITTDSPNDVTNKRLLHKGTLAAVIIILVLIAFVFGLCIGIPIRNKMCKQKEKGQNEQGSAAQYNLNNGGSEVSTSV